MELITHLYACWGAALHQNCADAAADADADADADAEAVAEAVADAGPLVVLTNQTGCQVSEERRNQSP